MAGNNNNNNVEEKKKRFHTLAKELVKLSRKKVEVAKELAKATDELDFVPEKDSAIYSNKIEPQEELDEILGAAVDAEKALGEIYEACADATFEAIDKDTDKEEVDAVKEAMRSLFRAVKFLVESGVDVDVWMDDTRPHAHVHPRLNQELDRAKKGANGLLDIIDLLSVRIPIDGLESRSGTRLVDFSKGLLGVNCGP